MEVLTISDFADDEAEATLTWRTHKLEFTFRPGAYTGEVGRDARRNAEIIAACVTGWNIEGIAPTDAEAIEKLPAGLITAIAVMVIDLSTQADLPEVPEKSPTG